MLPNVEYLSKMVNSTTSSAFLSVCATLSLTLTQPQETATVKSFSQAD